MIMNLCGQNIYFCYKTYIRNLFSQQWACLPSTVIHFCKYLKKILLSFLTLCIHSFISVCWPNFGLFNNGRSTKSYKHKLTVIFAKFFCKLKLSVLSSSELLSVSTIGMPTILFLEGKKNWLIAKFMCENYYLLLSII